MEPKIEPQGFIPKRPTNFQQHQRRIELLILEGMHDGKGWRPEAFPRYNELELSEHAPSSPAALTPHMTAAGFYREVWIKENGNDPRGDWPIRMAEAYAASETARADRAELEIKMWATAGGKELKRNIALKADLQRKDAALRGLLNLTDQGREGGLILSRADHKGITNGDQDVIDRAYIAAESALAPISVPAAPEVTPSPCCANPNMVVKGLCDLDPDSVYLHTKGAYAGACLNWRPTHNVCLNCGKEEKL